MTFVGESMPGFARCFRSYHRTETDQGDRTSTIRRKTWGSRVDRHEHIGLGKIGLDGFRPFVRDEAFENDSEDSGNGKRRN